jgi:hypothetical protein
MVAIQSKSFNTRASAEDAINSGSSPLLPLMKTDSSAVSLFRIVLWSWLAGIACLFLALQFSPPRFSFDAMDGALVAAVRSSLLYVLPPLLALMAWRWRRARVDLAVSAFVALLWTALTVGWWAIHFNPFPWEASMRNLMLLLPSILVPCMVFWRLVRRKSD